MPYVDAYVLPVPLAKLAEYRRLARKAGKIWIEHGALEVRECVADDVQPGKHTSFPQAVKLGPVNTIFAPAARLLRDAAREAGCAAVRAQQADCDKGMRPKQPAPPGCREKIVLTGPKSRRDRGVLVDRLQVAQGSRPGEREGDD